MTEAEARAWLQDQGVPRETIHRLDTFVDLLATEAKQQNLIAASTLDHVYGRHIVDSAQLLAHAPASGAWIDLGSGAGFPGLIVSAIGNRPVTLVESRPKRVAFLERAAETLAVSQCVTIVLDKVERIPARPAAIISARAFAPLDRLFTVAGHLADPETVWLLPKGAGAAQELARARETWQGEFTLVPSITQAESAIIVARGVRPRKRG